MKNRTPVHPSTLRAARRSVAVGVACLVAGGAMAVPSVAQTTEDEFRTEVPQLGGYNADASNSPISILLFEEVLPVPVGPGEPHGEMHGSYSRALLGSGPSSRGVGSSVWPGPLIGDGLSAFDPQAFYPLKADAKYPDGPYEDLGEDPDPENNRGDSNTRTGMFAYARGIDVYGESNGGGELIPGVFEAGNVKSVSTNTVIDGVLVAETLATMSDVAIAGGIVTMDGFQTRLISRSNGETAETDGTYEISGFEIMGQGYEFTNEGLVAGEPDGEEPALTIPLGLGNEIDLRDAIGVSVETAPVVEEIEGPSGTRSTNGLIITIDTTPLREAAGAVPLADIISQIPSVPEADGVLPCSEIPPPFNAVTPCDANPVSLLKSTLFTLATLSPEIQFHIGGAKVTTRASLPFEYTPPALPALAPPSATTGTVTQPVTNFTSPAPPVASAPEPAPQVAAAPATGQQVVAFSAPTNLPTGLSAGVLLLALPGIALVARGGRRLTMAALYGTSTAAVSSGSLPDIRAFARGEDF